MLRLDRQKPDYSQCCCSIRVPVGNVESSDDVNVIGSIPAPLWLPCQRVLEQGSDPPEDHQSRAFGVCECTWLFLQRSRGHTVRLLMWNPQMGQRLLMCCIKTPIYHRVLWSGATVLWSGKLKKCTYTRNLKCLNYKTILFVNKGKKDTCIWYCRGVLNCFISLWCPFYRYKSEEDTSVILSDTRRSFKE